MLGRKLDFVTVSKMTQVLNVYRVFAKSKTNSKLTVSEKAVHSQVMAMAIDLNNVYLDRAIYED